MFSLLASYNQARLQSKLYKAQAATLRANAQGTRNRSRAQAAAIERAQDNQLIAAHNLMEAANAKSHGESAARNQAGAAGFMSTGTNNQILQRAQQELDAQIAAMEQAASINMLNAWQSAVDTRRQGDIEAATLEAQADQQAMAAKSARTSANLGLISGIINAAASAYAGYQAGSQHNENRIGYRLQQAQPALAQARAGEISQEHFNAALDKRATYSSQYKVNPWQYAMNAANSGAYSGFHFVNSFNPYIGALSTDANNRKNNWGGPLSVLSGNVPYKVPAAGSIYAQF